MRIAFVANQHKTAFYLALGRRLVQHGAHVTWVSTGPRWSALLKHGDVPPETILDLGALGPEWTAAPPMSEDDTVLLRRIEAAGPLSIKNILIMDRGLNQRPAAVALAYAAFVSRAINSFFRAERPEIVLGETTWAVELLAAQIAPLHGGRYFGPSTVRTPSERIGFFEGGLQRSLAPLGPLRHDHREAAMAFMADFRKRRVLPYYLALNRDPTRFRAHWFEEAFRQVTMPSESRYDASVFNLPSRVRARLAQRHRHRQALKRAGFERAPERSAPFVLVTLHKQPEASVDVLGAPYNDQLAAIRAIARLLPVHWELYVKEHSAAIGDRSLDYYAKLRRIPGVRLIDPWADAFGMIRRAEMVVSPSGTASLEAGLLGRPAATLAPMYFGPVLTVNGLDPYSTTKDDLLELLALARADEASGRAAARADGFIASLIARSRPGMVGDPINAPACVETDNLDRLAAALKELYATLEPPTGLAA